MFERILYFYFVSISFSCFVVIVRFYVLFVLPTLTEKAALKLNWLYDRNCHYVIMLFKRCSRFVFQLALVRGLRRFYLHGKPAIPTTNGIRHMVEKAGSNETRKIITTKFHCIN